jgi:HK97 family phage major capsid protein
MRKEVQFETMQLTHQMRDILNRAEKEGRELTADEQSRYAHLEDRHDKIAGFDSSQELECYFPHDKYKEDPEAREIAERISKNDRGDSFRYWRNPSSPDNRSTFNRYLIHGADGIEATEFRALQADSDTVGGFLVVPLALQDQIITKLKDLVFMRQFARIINVPNAASAGFAFLDDDPGTYDISWTGELLTGEEDSTMDFERRDLYPHPLARRIKVSDKLLRVSTLNPEAIVRDRLTYVFSIAEEYQFLQGDGVNKPLGVFTASNFGIPTGRDVTSSASGSMTADDIFEVIYNQKAQYRQNGRFIMGRDAMKAVRTMKDGEGRWMWEPSMQAGQPARIAGYPLHESEYCPSYASGQYSMIFGDFSFYVICDALSMTIKRLVELYAETNQVGYIGRKETDAMPVNGEAFTRMQLA